MRLITKGLKDVNEELIAEREEIEHILKNKKK
jgi:hypothetical protein